MHDNHQLLKALTDTFNSSSREDRQRAESYLAEQRSYPGFCERLCNELEQPALQSNSSAERSLKKALLNYLSVYVSKLWESSVGDQTALKNSVLDRLVACLLSRTLSHEDKQDIVATIAAALVSDLGVHSYADSLVARAQQALKHRHLLVASYLIQAVLLSTKTLNTTVQIFKSCFPPLLEQLAGVAAQLEVLLNSPNNDIALRQAVITYETVWRVLAAEVRLLEFDKFKATCIQLVRSQAFFEAVLVALGTAPQTHKGQLVLLHENPLVSQLNKSREYALESLLHLLTGIRTSKFKLAELLHITSIYSKLLPLLVERLPQEILLRWKLLSEREEHEFHYPDGILKGYMQIAGIAARHPEYCEFFIQHREHIFCNVVLSMSMPDVKLRGLLLEQPMEYARSLIDMCDRQAEGDSRAGASKLLEAMCDKVDGSVSCFAEIAIALIRWGLQEPPSPPEGIFSPAMLACHFFRSTNWQYKLETGLLLLAEMSYLVDRRKDILEEMERLLDEFIDALMQHRSPYVTIALVICYEYYADSLYAQVKELSPTLQKFMTWVVHLTKVRQQPIDGLREELYSTLLQILTDPNLTQKFTPYIFPVLQQLLPNLVLDQAHHLISFFNDLLLMYSKTACTDRQRLLNLVEEVSKGVFSQQQPASQRTILIEKYLQLLRSLASSEDYFPYLEELCQALKPCLTLLCEKSCFHDAIIAVVNSCVKSTRQLRPQLTLLLQAADQLIEWNNHSLQRLFETVNLACIYSEPKDAYIVERSYELALRMMTATTEETIPNDLLQGCLLMHTLLFYHEDTLSATQKLRVLRQTLGFIDVHHAVMEIPLYAKYLLVVLQLINFDYVSVSQELQRMGRVEDVLQLLYDNGKHFTHDSYDGKLFSICQIQMLDRRWHQFSPNIIGKMFTGLVYVLRKLYDLSSNKQKEEEIDNEPTESSGDNSEEFDAPYDFFETYKSTMKSLVSPYKQMDEFGLFKKLLQKLRQDDHSASLLHQVVGQLPSDLSSFLKTALSVQKIQSSEGVQTRRIVRVKRQ